MLFCSITWQALVMFVSGETLTSGLRQKFMSDMKKPPRSQRFLFWLTADSVHAQDIAAVRVKRFGDFAGIGGDQAQISHARATIF